MKALQLIRQLRFQLQVEMLAIPDCEELKSTERALSIYEKHRDPARARGARAGMKVQEAFNHFSADRARGPCRRRAAAHASGVGAGAAALAGGASGGVRRRPEPLRARYFAAAAIGEGASDQLRPLFGRSRRAGR